MTASLQKTATGVLAIIILFAGCVLTISVWDSLNHDDTRNSQVFYYDAENFRVVVADMEMKDGKLVLVGTDDPLFVEQIPYNGGAINCAFSSDADYDGYVHNRLAITYDLPEDTVSVFPTTPKFDWWVPAVLAVALLVVSTAVYIRSSRAA